MKKCDICDREFNPNTNRQIYCSKGCGYIGKQLLHRQKMLDPEYARKHREKDRLSQMKYRLGKPELFAQAKIRSRIKQDQRIKNDPEYAARWRNRYWHNKAIIQAVYELGLLDGLKLDTEN